MRVDWSSFKSAIRNRISSYSMADMESSLIPSIRKYEALGFIDSAKQGINILHLYSILRWSLVYAQVNPRLAKKRLTEDGFSKIYNGAMELLDPELDDAWSFDEVMQYVTRGMMRSQKYLQTDAFRVCLVMLKILLDHIPKPDADEFASSYGFSSIQEFAFAHLHLVGLPYIQKRYEIDLGTFRDHRNLDALRTYVNTFFVDFHTMRSRVIAEHEANKNGDSLWKEMDDLTFISGMPGIRNGTKVTFISRYALGMFSGYSILSRISSERREFYSKHFADGYESFLYTQLSRIGKTPHNEQQIRSLLGKQQIADAMLETEHDAVFVEFKSCKSPRFPFEFGSVEDNRKSMKTSIHKGMIQIFESMKRYKEMHPNKRVNGVIVTLHDFFTGKPRQVAQELLTPEELVTYENELSAFGISSIIDFLPYAALSQIEFVEAIFECNAKTDFFQYSNKRWDTDTMSEMDSMLHSMIAFTQGNI